MSTLIAGHSQTKYFHKYLRPSDDIFVISRSDYRIEEMWDEIEGVVSQYDIIVIHCGANNLARDSVPIILKRIGSGWWSGSRIGSRLWSGSRIGSRLWSGIRIGSGWWSGIRIGSGWWSGSRIGSRLWSGIRIGSGCHPEDATPMTTFLTNVNTKARHVNTALRTLATIIPRLYYLPHPAFASRGVISEHK